MRDSEEHFYGTGVGRGSWAVSDKLWVEVGAGTPIYREGTREQFAVTTADTELVLVKDGDRVVVSMLTRWGWMTGEVDCRTRPPH